MSNDPNETNGGATTLEEVEQPKKKYKYPLAVPFIILNEFCERFNYYGMRAILVLYLTRKLMFQDNEATLLYHGFTTLVYFCCVFGAIIADSWLGKFKTILALSCVYVCGSTIVTLGAIEPWNLPQVELTIIGLVTIAIGSGGIKPCVAAFGGEQFTLPEQAKQMALFFSFFYFSINAGSLISTSITPILRQDVHCFGQSDCYPLAFGVPAVLMVTSIIVFIGGKFLYKIYPPQGNMFLKVCKCIGNAISTRSKKKDTEPKETWLDYAEEKYGKKLVTETKILLHVLVLYIPLPIFWALFEQQGSRWTFQATRMNGDIGFMEIKPDQVQVINPFLILLFIPLYEVAFYPLLNLVGVRRPLQKLFLGGTLAGVAFLLSGFVELALQPTYAVLPEYGHTQMRIFNGMPCDYSVKTNIPDFKEINVNSLNMNQSNVYFEGDSKRYDFEFVSLTSSVDCPSNYKETLELTSGKAISFFISGYNDKLVIVPYQDNPDKSKKSNPTVRILGNTRKDSHKFILKNGGNERYNEIFNVSIQQDVPFGKYDLLVDETLVSEDLRLRTGGVYTIVVLQKSNANDFVFKTIEVTEPNSLNILWQIPQYVIMTLGEVMYSITGLQFSFTQAPESMKSVLQGCWQLTVAVGNLIVVFIIGTTLITSQMWEFFFFAGFMFVDMFLFMILAYYYKPISLDVLHKIEEEENLDNHEKPSPLDFQDKNVEEKTKL